MSTQRRASRMIAATNMDRADIRRLTAPLMSIFWSIWAWFFTSDGKSRVRGTAWVATNSLFPDYHDETLALLASRSGSPPPGLTGVHALSGLRVTHRLSLRHAPLLPVCARFHTTLPIAPATRRGGRWAERHDGKRDLYIQHAA